MPLLRSGIKAPDYEVPDRMPVRRLNRISSMAAIGNLLSVLAVAAWCISLPLLALQMGMVAAQASGALVFAMLVGALVQYPVGWVSNHTDRRLVLLG